MPREYEAGRAGGLGDARHGPEVARIAHPVERDEERGRRPEELVEVGRAQRRGRRDDPLGHVAPGQRVDAFGPDDLRARRRRATGSPRAPDRRGRCSTSSHSGPAGARPATAPTRLAGLRPARRPTRRAPAGWAPASALAPDRAVGRVLEHDAARQQLVADAVGTGPVLGGARRLSLPRPALRRRCRSRASHPSTRDRGRSPRERTVAISAAASSTRPSSSAVFASRRSVCNTATAAGVSKSSSIAARKSAASPAATSGRPAASARRSSESRVSTSFSASPSSFAPISICRR